MILNQILFGALALIVVATAIGMITNRNALYSALLLALNFSTVALLYLFLGAPFIALVQVTVYAGSIMVLFLFVIMLLGAERLSAREPLRGQRGVAILLAIVFLFEVGAFLLLRSGYVTPLVALPSGLGSPKAIGDALFTRYALPVEVTAFILLVATVGAIVLTRGEKPEKMEIVQGSKEG